MRIFQTLLIVLVATLIGVLFGSNCNGLWLSIVFITVLSLLVPVVLLAAGKLKVPLIQGIAFYAFIGFSLFGCIAVLAGLFGDTGFLTSACTGTNMATKIAIKALGLAAKGL